MLLPGGGDLPQPRLPYKLALGSSGLYEEGLLQHWNHVPTRNKFVNLNSDRVTKAYIAYNPGFKPWVGRSSEICGYANAYCVNVDSDLLAENTFILMDGK